jgi:hypothetical protein
MGEAKCTEKPERKVTSIIIVWLLKCFVVDFANLGEVSGGSFAWVGVSLVKYVNHKPLTPLRAMPRRPIRKTVIMINFPEKTRYNVIFVANVEGQKCTDNWPQIWRYISFYPGSFYQDLCFSDQATTHSA